MSAPNDLRTATDDPSPPSQGPGPNHVERRAVLGVGVLAARQAIVQGLNVAGTILLARYLSPGEFGIYGIVNYFLSFLISFGDFGLGASLVREHARPSEQDYRAIFTFQQLVLGVLVVAMCVAALFFADAYGIRGGDRWMLHVAALSVLVTSFRLVPALKLERDLAFDKLAIADIAQALVFNGVAVTLALTGWGAWSFVAAIFARSLVGTVLVHLACRAPIGWAFDWPRVKARLAFGVPFQAVSIVSLIKDGITPLFVGMLAGAEQVGYITWSQTVAAYSVLAIMVFQRVYLPAFARLQDDRAALGAFVERIVWLTNSICAPLSILMFVLFRPFTSIVFGDKWLVAEPYFQLLWLANLVVPTAAPAMSLVTALGKARTALVFAVVWMAGTWVFGVPLILRYGAIGFAMANGIVQLSNFALFRIAQKLVPFRILRPASTPWLVATAMGAGMFALERAWHAANAVLLVAYVGLGLAVYASGMLLVDRVALLKMRDLLRGPS